jgi:hypothetical protein
MRFLRRVGLTFQQQQELEPFWASTLAVWRARRPAALALGGF